MSPGERYLGRLIEIRADSVWTNEIMKTRQSTLVIGYTIFENTGTWKAKNRVLSRRHESP